MTSENRKIGPKGLGSIALGSYNFTKKSWWLILTILVAIVPLSYQIKIARDLGNSPSGHTDLYTEETTLRSGRGFYEMGFTSNSGLADFCYGLPQEERNPNCIYTHYPQGSEWLAGLSHHVWGPENIARFRIFPILIWIVCHGFLIAVLLQAIGAVKTFWFNLLILIVPMYTNMMHGIYYQGMALAVLMAQIALAISMLSQKKRFNWYNSSAFFILGFIQGWLSFDYCFLATFFHLPFLFFLSPQNDRLPLFLKLSLLSGGGYTTSQVLHFLEVIHYFGGMANALQDFSSIASTRSQTIDISTPALIFKYWMVESRLKKFFNFNLTHLLVVMELALIFFAYKKKDFQRYCTLQIGVLTSLLITSLWIIAMKQHSFHHAHYITRHLFFFYFVAVWVILIEFPWKKTV
jgi:hypothetical protein